MKKLVNTKFVFGSVLDETLKMINLYRDRKSNTPYDIFYHSHLNCMEELIEKTKEAIEMRYAVIIAPEGHKGSNGSFSPVYVTVCKKPHWDTEGLMLQGSLYDATKFTLESEDLDSILTYCRLKFPTRKFKVITVDKCILGSTPRELWDECKGDFDSTKEIKGVCITDDKVLKGLRLEAETKLKEEGLTPEQRFHNSRKIFAIFNGKLNWCPTSGLSHYEWLVDGRICCEFVFDSLVRGFEDEEGIYFYSGDFETNERVEEEARRWMSSISQTKPVYCGMVKGDIGEKWKPIRLIRG